MPGDAVHPPGIRVWSIVCFYVQRRFRRQGVAAALLLAASAAARAHGADIVEATPVDPDSPSYRFMGFRSLFLAAGFEEVVSAGTRRHVMELALAPGPKPPGRRVRPRPPTRTLDA